MAAEMLRRDDLSVYVVAGVPKSFKKKLKQFVERESKADGNVMLLDEQLTDWVVARVQGDKRPTRDESPASSALWRAYRAVSAARYHLQDQELEGRVRELRNQIEVLWREATPVKATEEEEAEEAG